MLLLVTGQYRRCYVTYWHATIEGLRAYVEHIGFDLLTGTTTSVETRYLKKSNRATVRNYYIAILNAN